MRKHLLIVDLEATCFARGEEPANFFSEIIEIGAVLFDTATNTVTRQYQSFVRPTLYPNLSAFCKQLTTISQKVFGNVRGSPAWRKESKIEEVFRSSACYTSHRPLLRGGD